MIGTSATNSENKADKNFIGSIDTTFDHQAIKKYLLRPGRALINPFDPSQTTVRYYRVSRLLLAFLKRVWKQGFFLYDFTYVE